MSDRSQGETALVQFSERLTNSAAFGTLFREGMDLVEETAAYLDGAGRSEAKALDRAVSLTYATESMRLTTRLMQLASWLLLHRAVKEGEMTLTQANREKTKVKLSAADPGAADMIEKLPRAIAGSDRPLDGAAGQGSPSRRHHPCAGGGTRRDRQSAGAAAQPPEGGVQALSARVHVPSPQQKPPRAGAFRWRRQPERSQSFFRKPENFFWNRDTRPPRSRICCAPPVQAGCDLESISRCSLSPALPQVERVVFGAVGHHDLNQMIIGVGFGLRGGKLRRSGACFLIVNRRICRALIARRPAETSPPVESATNLEAFAISSRARRRKCGGSKSVTGSRRVGNGFKTGRFETAAAAPMRAGEVSRDLR